MTLKYWKTILSVLILGLLLAISIIVWSNKTSTIDLTLNFKAMVDNKPLVFNKITYANPGGAGKFKVRDFQFYISNIRLLSPSGEFIEQESYHLARFDNNNSNYTIVLKDMPRREYQTIELSIGVDKIANSSIHIKGDLDPNSRMAWSWDVGYKFVLFEGGILKDDILRPLVYHVGFNENYKSLSFVLKQPLFENNKHIVNFEVDLLKLFSGINNINMSELPSVKFDRKDAKSISDNYKNMIEISLLNKET